MRFRESETVEFKQTYTEEIRKEIIAMANTAGGVIYVGIADNGEVVGVEDSDAVIQRISNGVRDAIKPDVTMFVSYETMDVADRQIVCVTVQCGASRPYYLAAKGLRPEGVYVRQGTSSVPASDAAIRRMIVNTDGDNYEDMRSLRQDLTFKHAEAVFAERKLELGIPQMKTLGLIGVDGIYTNLGLLLSDQCPHIIKAATFDGMDQQNFHDRREFSGSLLKQLGDAYAYLDLRNQTRATFEGLYRTDHRDYPETALREALLNAIVHRDYAFSASTLISIYSDRIEFVSIGGLVQGITLEDVLMGLSVCRNQKLANIFYRLELIEAYGTGMRKIQTAYQNENRKPEISASSNAFKIVLPRWGEKAVPQNAIHPQRMNQTDVVLNCIRGNGDISRREIEELLGIKTVTAIRLLRKMQDQDLIVAVGQGRNTRYVLK